MPKPSRQLTQNEKDIVILKLLKGIPITMICRELNVGYHIVRKYCARWESKPVPAEIGAKQEPYYNNELDYSRIPTYTWDSLNDKELEAYNNYKLKNKAYYATN